MSKRDWYFLNNVVGVCRHTTLPEFSWIYWAPGTQTVEGSDPLPEGMPLDVDFSIQAEWLQENWLPGFMARIRRGEWNNPHLPTAKPKSVADIAVEFLASKGFVGLSPQAAQNVYVLYQRRGNQAWFKQGAAFATEEEVAIAKSL